VVGEGAEGDPDPGVALTRADGEIVAAEPCAGAEALVATPPLPPPKPAPPPWFAPPPTPRPAEGLTPRLRPEDPALAPTPRLKPAESETLTDAERLAPRTGLPDGPTTMPPPAPTPGSSVSVARTQPFRMLPPLLQVPVVMSLLSDVGIVTGELRLSVLSIPPEVVGVLREIDAEGRFTPTPAPTVTDAAIVAETLTLGRGMLSESEDKDDKRFVPVGRPESSDKIGRAETE
jgi:hypothetical protein